MAASPLRFPFESRVPALPFAVQLPQRRLVVRAARAWSPERSAAAPAVVVLVGGVIELVTWGPWAEEEAATDASTIELSGELTLLPGLVDCHSHPTFSDSFEFATAPFATLANTTSNLRTLLRAGFTSINGAAASKVGVEVLLRSLVHAGRIEGPRWRVAGPELTPPGGLGCGNVRSSFESDCFGKVCATRDELLAAVDECASLGCDSVKINISGEEMVLLASGEKDVKSTFDAADVAAVVARAHVQGMRVAAHARGSGSVRDALVAGVDVLYHCDFTTPACRDAILGAGEGLLLGPSLGFLDRVAPVGLPDEPLFDAPAKLAASIATHLDLFARGGDELICRTGIGGDYGFAVTPHGDNAYDVELYTRLLGLSPIVALRCATLAGAKFMAGSFGEGNGLRVGTLSAGAAADLVAVRGDATVNVRCLRDVALVIANGRIARLDGGTAGLASSLVEEPLANAVSGEEAKELLREAFRKREPGRATSEEAVERALAEPLRVESSKPEDVVARC